MLQRCVKSAKKCLLFFFEYIILQSHAIMCLHLRDSPHGQAASDEPLSRTDKARGISQKYNHPNIHHYIIGGLKSQARSSALFKRLVICSRVKKRKAEYIIIGYSLAILRYCYHALTVKRLSARGGARRGAFPNIL